MITKSIDTNPLDTNPLGAKPIETKPINTNLLDDKTLDWLLEKNNPSVRYFTLRDILKLEPKDKVLVEAKKAIMTQGIVPEILSLEHDDGYWTEADKFYTAKYKGTVWQLMILAELGASGDNEKIKKACEFILLNAHTGEKGAFAMKRSKKEDRGLTSEIVPCLTANMVWALIKFGYLDHVKVQDSINWLLDHQNANDGEKANDSDTSKVEKQEIRYHEICFGSHTCFMGLVKTLKAFSVIPIEQRTDAINNKINTLAEFLLMHHIYKQSHNLNRVSKPGWKKLGFPLMYQTDILEIMSILTDLGIEDPRMDEARALLIQKRNEDGRWILENSFNGKMHIDIEVKNEPSKWITLKSINVLNKLG